MSRAADKISPVSGCTCNESLAVGAELQYKYYPLVILKCNRRFRQIARILDIINFKQAVVTGSCHLTKPGIEADIIFESNIMACTVRAIKEGVGCGFLPLPFVAHDLKKNQLSVLGPPGGYWEYPLYIYLKDQHKNEDPIAAKVGQILRSYY